MVAVPIFIDEAPQEPVGTDSKHVSNLDGEALVLFFLCMNDQ